MFYLCTVCVTSRLPSFTADAGSSATPAVATSQQILRCGGTASPQNTSLTPTDRSPGALSPEETSFNSNTLGEMVRIILLLF